MIDIPPPELRNDLCSAKQTLELFRVQVRGDYCDAGEKGGRGRGGGGGGGVRRSAYEPFRAL